MDRDNDPHATASDIITYIGVPLAVLGVLPILYNTIVTLAALSKIKRMLRHSQLKALTRSDVVNRVIEVDLPRYAVTPLDRLEQRDEYWSLSRHPSSIPGGSWTTFNWRTNAIGSKTQRVEYADQLRQPQVEVEFQELISYLLDLGAVPEPYGWRLLKTTGLWTPVGCALMMSPDGSHKALTVAPLDDSDGNLSLAVNWSSHWITRSHSSLPPYWVSIPAPQAAASEKAEKPSSSGTMPEPDPPASSAKSVDSDSKSVHKSLSDSVQEEANQNAYRSLSCHVSIHGLVTALPTDESGQTVPDNLYIDHLRISKLSTNGIWFASAVTAFGTSGQTILWNYKIPDNILAFSRKDSVPCGVLEMLEIVTDNETPEWATKYDDMSQRLDMQMRKAAERTREIAKEHAMSPADRAKAMSERVRREGMEQLNDMRERLRQDKERQEKRIGEAFQSPKWNATRVAEHTLRWLKNKSHVSEFLSVKEAAGTVLHRMILDGQFANAVCRLLDSWNAWTENAGMRKSDLEMLKEEQVVFSYASLLVSVIRDTGKTDMQVSVALDLQECLMLWKKVRLG